jgi:hypothetical protein
LGYRREAEEFVGDGPAEEAAVDDGEWMRRD